MAPISGPLSSFQMNLYDALFPKRPVVEPELFASLRPPTYSGGFGYPILSKIPPAPQSAPADMPAEKKEAKSESPPSGGFGMNRPSGLARETLQELGDKMDLGKSVSSAASASKL